MGTLSVTAKNAAAQAVADLCTHAGLFGVTAISGTTGTASSNVFSKTAHGLVDGDAVLLTALTGGSGLTAGNASNANGAAKVYFVISAATDTFKLSADSGGSEVDFTTDISAVTVNKVTELTGGSPAYARQALSKNAASAGAVSLSNTPVFDVPASSTIGAVGYHTAASAGSRHGIDGVVFETFAAQGTYTLTSGTISASNL